MRKYKKLMLYLNVILLDVCIKLRFNPIVTLVYNSFS